MENNKLTAVQESFCVYRHRRNDTNQIFYIGIGKNIKRAYDKKSRNKHWRGVVNKYGYQVEIIQEVETWEDACELEMFLIEQYGRKDLGLGNLVNLTDGGDGCLGLEPWNKGTKGLYKHSEETKLKMSADRKGESNSMFGKRLSSETKEKITLALTGKKASKETKEKMSDSRKGKKHTVEAKLKMKIARNSKVYYKGKAIYQTDEEGNIIKEFTSTVNASKELGICRTGITAVLNGTQKTTKGLYFKFK